MSLIIEEKDLAKFILIGDKVLIRPKNPKSKTASGQIKGNRIKKFSDAYPC